MYTYQTISKMLLVLSLLGLLNAQCIAETKNLESAQATASNQTYVVRPGDIFGKVCQKYQPEGVSLKRVMAAFYELNKSAFKNGDQTKLIVGSSLIVPSPQALGATIPVIVDNQLSARGATAPAKAVSASEENSKTKNLVASNDAVQTATLTKPETATSKDEVIPEQNTPQAPVIKVNKTASTSTLSKNIGLSIVVIFAIGAYLRKRKKLIEEQAKDIQRLLG
jgi:Tfp pilus assembly protein FimV